jgi:hypothetical protein
LAAECGFVTTSRSTCRAYTSQFFLSKGTVRRSYSNFINSKTTKFRIKEKNYTAREEKRKQGRRATVLNEVTKWRYLS